MRALSRFQNSSASYYVCEVDYEVKKKWGGMYIYVQLNERNTLLPVFIQAVGKHSQVPLNVVNSSAQQT